MISAFPVGDTYQCHCEVVVTQYENGPLVDADNGDPHEHSMASPLPLHNGNEIAISELPEGRSSNGIASSAAPRNETQRVSRSSYSSVSFVSLAPVPRFPTHVLPTPIRRFVAEAAEAHGVPEEFVGVPLLTNAGAVVGRTAALDLKRGFRVWPVLWSVVVAEPGTGKTPASDSARAPLDHLQATALAAHEADLALFDQQLAEWERAEKSARGNKPTEPTLEHFVSSDATTEAVARMLADSAGFALQRDEIVAFVKGFDAYRSGRGGDRQNWLSLWSSTPLKVDRKSVASIIVPRPVVGVSGGCQPEMLGELADEAGRRDGFLERFLWAMPDIEGGSEWTEKELSTDTMSAVDHLFERLRGSSLVDTRIVTLSADAKQRWAEWFNANAVEQPQHGLLAGVRTKMPVQVARLALILWCLEHPENPDLTPLDADVLDRAILLGDYFSDHAARVMPLIDNGAARQPRGVRRRLMDAFRRATTGDGWLSRSELHALLGGHVPAPLLDEELAVLAGERLLENRRRTHNGPGRPADEWRASERINSVERDEVRL